MWANSCLFSKLEEGLVYQNLCSKSVASSDPCVWAYWTSIISSVWAISLLYHLLMWNYTAAIIPYGCFFSWAIKVLLASILLIANDFLWVVWPLFLKFIRKCHVVVSYFDTNPMTVCLYPWDTKPAPHLPGVKQLRSLIYCRHRRHIFLWNRATGSKIPGHFKSVIRWEDKLWRTELSVNRCSSGSRIGKPNVLKEHPPLVLSVWTWQPKPDNSYAHTDFHFKSL